MRQLKLKIALATSTAVVIVLVVLPVVPLLQTVAAAPSASTFGSYLLDEQAVAFIRGMSTQFVLTLCGTLFMGTLVLSAGYGLSLLGGVQRAIVGLFFVIPVVIDAGLIPTYILVRAIGLIDHPLVLILAERIDVLLVLAATLVFARGETLTLREAASVDGAGPLSAMLRVVLPAHPQLITTVVALSALRFWNAWFPAFLFVHSQALVPAQNRLRSMALRTESGIASGLTRAGESVSEPRIALYALVLLIPGLVLVRIFRSAAMSALTIDPKRGKK